LVNHLNDWYGTAFLESQFGYNFGILQDYGITFACGKNILMHFAASRMLARRLKPLGRSVVALVSFSTLLFLLNKQRESSVYYSSESSRSSISHLNDPYWEEHVCKDVSDAVCHHVLVVEKRRVTFCSAAKVASTTLRQYFYEISGDLVIPDDARFGVHEANWTRLAHVEPHHRIELLKSPAWTHVFFMRDVLERFISGYLDKVVHDCEIHDLDTDYPPEGPLMHYRQFGFSCEEHTDLEAFVTFMESVPSMEGHFAPQTPLCNVKKYPYTDIIRVDDRLSNNLADLSIKLGVQHPKEKGETRSHGTGAKQRMKSLFENREDLVPRILKLFKQDCDVYPESCVTYVTTNSPDHLM
jgi:hypothetical protein